MNKAIRSVLAVAVAFGAGWAVQPANAQTDVAIVGGVPVQPGAWPAQPAYVPQAVNPAAPTIYVPPGYGFGSPWEQQRAWQEAQWREQQWRERHWREHERREHEWRERHGWRR